MIVTQAYLENSQDQPTAIKTKIGIKPEIKSILNPGLDQLWKSHPIKFDHIGYDKSEKMKIFVVGAGGTGGYVIRDLARFIYSIYQRDPDRANIELSIIDPDIVEEKNVLRQNFLPSDIGKHKAEVLAKRHSAAFGIPITYYNSKFDSKIFGYNSGLKNIVIIGCVDNNQARRDISDSASVFGSIKPVWIDSGNERKSGQVILGSRGKIPTVMDLFPELKNPENDSKNEISCAERMLEDEQNIFVNVTASNLILNFVRKLALQEPIAIHGTAFNIDNKFDNYVLLDVNMELE